jgi:MacB-like periplasmic core domain
MPWHVRWWNAFRSDRLNGDLETELKYHLAETADALVADGMDENEALQVARQRLGNYSLQKERTRDMNVAHWLDETRADIIYGVRQLASNPGFTVIAVLSLALGIGANAAIFQLVNAIRLKMLPVLNPKELVSIDFEKGAMRAGRWTGGATMTYPEWEQIKAQQQAFSGVLAWSSDRFSLTNGGEPQFANGIFVSGDFFRQLGVRAILGRTLTAQDDTSMRRRSGS